MQNLRQQYDALNDDQVAQKKELAGTAVTKMFEFASRLPLLGISNEEAIKIKSKASCDILKQLVGQLYEGNADYDQGLANIQKELSKILDRL